MTKPFSCQYWSLGLLLLLCFSSSVLGQGSQDQDSQDSENSQDSAQMIGGSDPNLVNPQNKQGYGRNIQTQLLPTPKTTVSTKPTTTVVTDTMGEQSIQAVLQLGVLIGVALLCGVLFMMMVGFELMCECIKEKLSSMIGRKKVLEVSDPAALVGTFKRYK